MENQFERTQLLFGKEAMEKLKNSHVAVFGAGGVGGYVIEALARSGVGEIDIIDHDVIETSNINRQILATSETIGTYKAEAAKKRIALIDPSIRVNAFNVFYLPETSDMFDFAKYDYIADAIDTVTGKIELISNAQKSGCPIISSMGTGNKIHPEMLEVADIYDTSVCPLARVMRSELKKRGIASLKVVYSKEKPICPSDRSVVASTPFVPPVAGFIMAGEIIKDLIFSKEKI